MALALELPHGHGPVMAAVIWVPGFDREDQGLPASSAAQQPAPAEIELAVGRRPAAATGTSGALRLGRPHRVGRCPEGFVAQNPQVLTLAEDLLVPGDAPLLLPTCRDHLRPTSPLEPDVDRVVQHPMDDRAVPRTASVRMPQAVGIQLLGDLRRRKTCGAHREHLGHQVLLGHPAEHRVWFGLTTWYSRLYRLLSP